MSEQNDAGSREDRIRARAYQIWESKGLPIGGTDDHWRRAETEVDAEIEFESGGGSAEEKKKTTPDKSSKDFPWQRPFSP